MRYARNSSTAKLLAIVFSVLVAACASTGITQDAPVGAAGRTRGQVAMVMYQERCQRAGEKIYETAENVEGLLLMKLRTGNINFSDQFKLDDPYGRDLHGEGYLHSFLRGSSLQTGVPAVGAPPGNGYRYVEATDPVDGKRYRYTGSVKVVGQKK